MLLPLKPEATEQPRSMVALTAEEIKRYAGKFMHAPQTWEVFAKDGKLFLKDAGKDFELKKTGKDRFSYEQGEVLFVLNTRGEFEHIFMGLYEARKVP